MAEPYRCFGSYILFREAVADDLGHLYRAGEFDRTGVKRTVWLRVFDGPGVPSAELAAQAETANRVGEILQAANVAASPRLVVEEGVPALGWDFVSGQPLNLVLQRARAEGFPVPVDIALLILERLSLGLAAALAVEVGGVPLVHGFLHPGLVVVTNDGEGLVAGFGAADRLLGLLDAGARVAAARSYLAPEVLISRTASLRGDVYSLGAILFELLTGGPLPEQPEARAGALDTAQMPYDELPVPPDIKGLLQRALAGRPEDRFSSAADFKNELDKLLYGGAYSPTTFNLALFMDRLFRPEIDAEERERAAERSVSVEPYLRREPEPVEEEVVAPAPRRGLGPWIAVAAGVVAVGVVAVALLGGRGRGEVATPTPTAEDVEAQKVADAAKIRELVERELGRLMAEKEKEIQRELAQRQAKIDEYQKKLKDLETGAAGGVETAEARRRREELERQIAAERAAKVERERKLEEERQRALEEARRRAEESAEPLKTPVAGVARPTPSAAGPTLAAGLEPTSPPARPTVTQPEPTGVARVEPTAAPVEAARPTASAVGSGLVQPQRVSMVPPRYTAAAERVRAEGDVQLRLLIGRSGEVLKVEVLQGLKWGLTEEAVRAVKQWKFRPATMDGEPVEAPLTVTVHFGLSGTKRD